jgi:hypothetical protein
MRFPRGVRMETGRDANRMGVQMRSGACQCSDKAPTRRMALLRFQVLRDLDPRIAGLFDEHLCVGGNVERFPCVAERSFP